MARSPSDGSVARNPAIGLPSRPLAAAALLSLLTLAAYGGSVRNGFVWDDETLVVKNASVKDLSLWPSYFTRAGALSSDPTMSRVYRPLQTLSLAVDARVWGGRAGGFHATSLLIQAALCVSVFFLFRGAVGGGPSLAAAAVFAIHPALSEGVLSLANRGGHLSALFGVVSAGLFLRARRPLDGRHLLSVASFALALLAKEPAIALVALLPLCQAALETPCPFRPRASIALHAPYAATAALYLVARQAVVGSMAVAPWWGGSPLATLLLQAKVHVVYLRLLAWPFRLQGRYAVAPLQPFPDAAVVASLLLHAALIGGAAWAWRRPGAPRLAALAVFWFYVSLLPVSNLVPIPGSMLGERFVTLPFAGMLPLLAGAAAVLPLRRGAGLLAVAAVAVGAAFVATDRARTRTWASELAFFELLVRQVPDDPAVQVRTAEVEVKEGKPAEAVARLERLLSRGDPALVQETPRYWYARALLDLGRVSEARRQIEAILASGARRNPELVLAWTEALARDGDPLVARAELERASAADPANDALWNARGNVAWMLGDRDRARASWAEALRLNPRNVEAETNLRRLGAPAP